MSVIEDLHALGDKLNPNRNKLALIFFEASRSRVPRGCKEWWALGWDMKLGEFEAAGNVDRWYEIHPYRVWESGMSPPLDDRARYTRWLDRLPGKKVLWEPRSDVRDSVGYPIDAVMAMPGVGGYLASSMSFMLCQAVLEGWRDIGIYGCDFYPYAEWQELAFERPNLAYLIGLWRAQGIRIDVPQQSSLWELELLDDIVTPLPSPPMKLFHEEYLRGLRVGRAIAEDRAVDTQHPPLPWKMVPFYSHETLEEVGATPAKYAALIRREKGMVV